MFVVVRSPEASQFSRSLQVVENFQRKKLVPEATVEAFCVGVFPWTSWSDVQRSYIKILKPSSQLLRDQLGAIVTADELREPSRRS